MNEIHLEDYCIFFNLWSMVVCCDNRIVRDSAKVIGPKQMHYFPHLIAIRCNIHFRYDTHILLFNCCLLHFFSPLPSQTKKKTPSSSDKQERKYSASLPQPRVCPYSLIHYPWLCRDDLLLVNCKLNLPPSPDKYFNRPRRDSNLQDSSLNSWCRWRWSDDFPGEREGEGGIWFKNQILFDYYFINISFPTGIESTGQIDKGSGAAPSCHRRVHDWPAMM